MTISLIVPTYNEAENIEGLIEKASLALSNYKHEIIIVDDNSPDKTAEIASRLKSKFNVEVFVRYKDRGLSQSVIYGMKRAKGDILGVIDADLSHPPELIPKLISALAEADIAIASRWVRGGGSECWPGLRRIISLIGCLLARPLTRVKDPLSGFFFLKKKVIEGINLKTRGYKILLEILVKGKYEKPQEIPFIFRDRSYGKSKLGLKISIEYFFEVLSLYFYKFLKLIW